MLQYKSTNRLVIDVQGVGYDVAFCKSGLGQLPELGQEVFLHIYTSVREDAIALYGFIDSAEKELFTILLGVSGVGPKLALNLLSAAPPAALARAVLTDDLHALTKLPGVGKKTAERLCLELKDKVQAFADAAAPADTVLSPKNTADERLAGDVISALVNLGYPQIRAREALAKVMEQHPPELPPLPIEEVLRLTLRSLA
ncbi:MAG: Holliday junction branch migration protein RuvA [Deltaproteobacteria bacterium]|nr:Holliday junction branch migration protein RuvA [Deltaproteobacteria bacterium]